MTGFSTPRSRSRPSTSVIEAVAEAKGVAAVDLPPLHDVVDPDALDALFDDRFTGTVAFRYEDRRVTVYADGEVSIEDETREDL